jgi:FMN-dependent NADH-azoreductase
MVVRSGKTFRYHASGPPEGLVPATTEVLAIVVSAATYTAETGMSQLDHETPYLRFILGFLGLNDVKFVLAGGTAGVMRGQISPEAFTKPYLQEVGASI